MRRERRGNISVVVSDCMTVDKSILLKMLASKTKQNEMYFYELFCKSTAYSLLNERTLCKRQIHLERERKILHVLIMCSRAQTKFSTKLSRTSSRHMW